MTEPNFWTTPYSVTRAIIADRLYAALAAAEQPAAVAVEEPPTTKLSKRERTIVGIAYSGRVLRRPEGRYITDLSNVEWQRGAPLLREHDPAQQLGTIERVWRETDDDTGRRCLCFRAVLRREVAADLIPRIRSGDVRVSVGWAFNVEGYLRQGARLSINGRTLTRAGTAIHTDALVREVSLCIDRPPMDANTFTMTLEDFEAGDDDSFADVEPAPPRRAKAAAATKKNAAPKPAPRAAATKLRHVSPLEFAADARRAGGDVALVPMRGRVSLLAAGGSDALPRFKMLVQSGQRIAEHHFWRNLYVDVAGIRVARQRLAVLLDHDPDKRIGYTTSIRKTKDGLVAEGFLLSTPLAQQVAQEARDGFPFECSCALPYSLIEEVRAGATARVNGMDIEGPATIWRKTNLREVTFTAIGADSRTHVEVGAA